MTRFLHEKYKLQKNSLNTLEKDQILADISFYGTLARIHSELAYVCCSDVSLGSIVSFNLPFENMPQEKDLAKESLKKIFYPKIVRHLKNLNPINLPSPQWLAMRGIVAYSGRYNIKPTECWERIQKEKIQEFIEGFSKI